MILLYCPEKYSSTSHLRNKTEKSNNENKTMSLSSYFTQTTLLGLDPATILCW